MKQNDTKRLGQQIRIALLAGAVGILSVATVSPAYAGDVVVVDYTFSGQELAGNNNKASGAYSSVSGGASNTAVGKASSITGGYNNKTFGTDSSIVGGENNSVWG